MARSVVSKQVWLVDTIYRAGSLTFEEIDSKWRDHEMTEKGLSKRTFHKWLNAIKTTFGLRIVCNNVGYRYSIENADEVKSRSLRGWLLDTVSVSNLFFDNMQLKDRILLEEIPSGKETLAEVLAAMKTNSVVTITYHSYWVDESATFDIHPYCVKLFKQRWYVVAYCPNYDSIRIYALDRINTIEKHATDKFSMPRKFDAAEYFMDYYGVIVGTESEKAIVKLKVKAQQANYLRSLRLHWSQEELERNEEYSIFKLSLYPEFDFQQEILSMGSDVEVLAPDWLRDEIAAKVKGMYDNYK